MTAFNRYDSPKGGVKDIRKVCQFYGEVKWSCGKCKGVWRGVAAVSILRGHLTAIWEV